MNSAVTDVPASGRLFELLEAVSYASQHDDVVVRFEDGKVRIAPATEPLRTTAQA